MNNKILIATIVFNSNKITNECFIPSLYKHIDENLFDLLIVTTSATEFKLYDQYKCYTNISFKNFNKEFNITTHGQAIQKILDINKNIYDDIIICENDTIIKQNLLQIVDTSFQFVGQDSSTYPHRHWWTRLYSQLKLGCQRYLPMLMYFNTRSFKNMRLIYELNDCNLSIQINTLNINIKLSNTHLCDPGWYFLIWTQKNNIKCKNINIEDYIQHFWYGSENRNKDINEYNNKLIEFKNKHINYL